MSSQLFFRIKHTNLTKSLLIIFIAYSSALSANAFDDEWKAFKQAQEQEFNAYVSELDKAFIAHLEKQWEEFQVFSGKVRDLTPKPAVAPETKNFRERAKPSTASPSDEYLNNASTRDHNSPFSNIKVGINRPTHLFSGTLSNKSIAKAWQKMASSEYKSSVSFIQNTANNLQLGDWGVYVFIQHQIGQLNLSKNEAKLYEWFLLSKLGYSVRLAYDRDEVYLLFPAKQNVYGLAFINFDKNPFYLATKKTGRGPLLSYKTNYQQNPKYLDLSFSKTIAGSGALVSSKLSYPSLEDKTQKEQLVLLYDPMVSSLYNAHPQIDLQYYFSAEPSASVISSVRKQLGDKLSQMSKRDAVNYLLNVVQNGFKYSRDDEQFGEENYLLTEESLNYLTNDCEDRSIFLSWLISDLLGIKVVGLDFPGHIALAVELDDVNSKDWYVKWNGHKYVIADPTYIGASAGMIMPSVKGQTPKIISF